MRPFRSVLCTVDFSEEGEEAIRQADALARVYQARLIAYHAMPMLARSAPLFPHLALADNSALVALERRALEALAARVSTITGRASSDFDLELGSGTPHSAIVADAERLEVDLIVVGGAGPKGVVRALLGAIAERVVRHAHCAVWVARPGPLAGPVIAGTDLSDTSLPAIDAAIDYAKRRGVKATVVHALGFEQVLTPMPSAGLPAVWSPDDLGRIRAEVTGQLEATVRRFDPSAEQVVEEGRPAPLLLELASRLGAGLICVGTNSLTGLGRAMLGSVAEEVVRKASCSVLVVRAQAER